MRRLLAALLLSISLPADHADAADAPVLAPAPPWVKPQTIERTRASSDAPIAFLLFDQQVRFGPDVVETYTETATRLQTSAGLQAAGTIQIPWMPETDELIIHKLHILRGSETIDVLGGGQSFTVLRRESNLEAAALDGMLTAALQPEGLQVDDIVVLAVTLRRKSPLFDGKSEWMTAWPAFPVNKFRVSAAWEDQQPVSYRLTNLDAKVKEAKTPEGRGISLAVDDYQPPIPPKGAPARFLAGPQVAFSQFPSWAAIAADMAPLYAKAAVIEAGSPLAKEVERIKQLSPDPAKRAEAALMLVQERVRYFYLGMNEGNLVPATAAETWARRFGDCKGKTALLLAMLRELGIEAEPVAVSAFNGNGLDERLPMVASFDHVLVRATIGGRSYWLDGTRMGDRKLDAVPVPAFFWGLPLKPGADLVRIEPKPLDVPERLTSIHIDATKGIVEPAPFKAEHHFQGPAAVAMQAQLSSLGADALDAALREYWRKEFDFVTLGSVARSYDEAAATLTLSMQGTAKMDWAGARYEADDVRLGYAADFARPAGSASVPFAVSFPSYYRTVQTILLPENGKGFSVESKPIDQTVAGVAYRRQAKVEGGVFTVEASWRSIAPEFAAAEAEAAAKTLKEMSETSVYLVATEVDQAIAVADAMLGKAHREEAQLVARFMHGEPEERAEALKQLNLLIERDPRAAGALAARSIVRALDDQIPGAEADLLAGRKISAEDPALDIAAAYIALARKDDRVAVESLSRAIEAGLNSGVYYYARGEAYNRLGEYQKALADRRIYKGIDPSDADNYLFLANIYRRLDRQEEALAEARAVVSANPTDSYAYIVSGAILHGFGRKEEAMQAFDRSIEIEPTPTGFVNRAGRRGSKEAEAAIEDYDAALKLEPQMVEALTGKASVLAGMRRHADALAILEGALAKTDDMELISLRGVIRAQMGDAAAARRDFEQARAKATEPTQLNILCWDKATYGVALETALAECDAAIAGTRNAGFLDSKGLALFRMKRFAESIRVYSEALAMSPGLAEALYGRGLAKLASGDRSGEADLAAARRADPGIDDQFAQFGLEQSGPTQARLSAPKSSTK